jgi:hypothetical protein
VRHSDGTAYAKTIIHLLLAMGSWFDSSDVPSGCRLRSSFGVSWMLELRFGLGCERLLCGWGYTTDKSQGWKVWPNNKHLEDLLTTSKARL